MQVQERHSYRYAEEILDKAFPTEKNEILHALRSTPFVLRDEPTIRRRGGRIVARLTIDQVATNSQLETAFEQKGWISKPRIISGSESKLEADFKKIKTGPLASGSKAVWGLYEPK